MKNNEWNVPSDYFEKNKKALMPVQKFPTGKWILVLAAACVIGVGFFMWKGKDQNQEIAEGKGREEEVREVKNGEDVGAKYLSPEKEDVGAKNLSPEKENIGAKYLSPKEEISEGLKEIPREELVAYLLEEDSDLIENIN
jgi:hypothetical protein